MNIFYICDPKKNKTCKKTSCQKTCMLTTREEYAKRDEYGEPLEAFKEVYDQGFRDGVKAHAVMQELAKKKKAGPIVPETVTKAIIKKLEDEAE